MDRWDRAGRAAAYGAGLALTPYLLIKVSWVVGSLIGVVPLGNDFSLAEWVVLNTVTVGMAAIGITPALALVRPWGLRIPGAPLVFVAWVGAGFLVSVLPFALLGALLGAGGGDGGGGDDPAMPAWEGALVEVSFAGMGLGLAIALPAHLRRRWPAVFAGRVGDAAGRASTALPCTAVAADRAVRGGHAGSVGAWCRHVRRVQPASRAHLRGARDAGCGRP